jgi:hypothetical protein
MKKQLVFMLLFFSLFATSSFALDFGLGLGRLGVALDSFGGTYDAHLHGRFLNATLQTNSGFGFSFSPFAFSYQFTNTDNYLVTFANIFVYYNLLKDKNVILGPFAAFNALEPRQLDFFETRAGATFVLRNVGRGYTENSILDLDLLFIETGYIYRKGNTHSFFATIGMDFVVALMFFGTGQPRNNL